MTKVVFLDRDGVINLERGDYTYKLSHFNFVEGLFEALKKLKNKGFSFIIITNQGGIAKGIYNHSDVNNVHNYIQKEFAQQKLTLLDIYYCPHHSDIESCICRKPDSLMLEKAIAKYNVNVKASYFIGDSERDILAANKVNIKGIRVIANDDLNKYINKL